MNWKQAKRILGKAWYFIWEDDSLLSWIVNIILAFVIVKFLIYPGLGLVLSTSYPVVAVVSSSMEHDGQDFEKWWEDNGEWYVENGIEKDEMEGYSLKDGFNKGDIIILLGKEPKSIKSGTVVVYSTERYAYPIIHRITKSWESDNKVYFQTKGDNNPAPDPEIVTEEKILGKAVIRVPLLGWIKIIFTEMIGGI
ncbi:MAG: signal peptidase I [Candidatus Woesearchaeota archaeon]